ncbi:hypothetical protein [Pararhizobium sp. O133]|uniref:hypothetical protein n=1 Tax=Pararhizobium sp. O133 TaxID=3449278 RepID=UPI003F683C16
MGMNGNRIDRRGAGKLFAVLWILAAALAMQFVASAQGFSSRFSTQQNAGNVAVPESGPTDTTLSRHVMRAFPVADLRFTADRADGKASPGGPVPFLLPAAILVAGVTYGGMPVMALSRDGATGRRGDIIRVRGPPAFGA